MTLMQYEFPFTRRGAMQNYSFAQKYAMNEAYYTYLLSGDWQDTSERHRQWTDLYIDNGGAKRFNEGYRYTHEVVEKQNEVVLQRWKMNSLEKRIQK